MKPIFGYIVIILIILGLIWVIWNHPVIAMGLFAFVVGFCADNFRKN